MSVMLLTATGLLVLPPHTILNVGGLFSLMALQFKCILSS